MPTDHGRGNNTGPANPPLTAYNEVAAPVSGSVVQAHTIHGGIYLQSTQPSPVMPRQLPASPRPFAGRAGELAALTAVLDTAAGQGTMVRISAICGSGGIGKTWLALYWAHQHVDLFPDGQLHVNLLGFDPREQPMPMGTAVRRFLDALGADPATLPVEVEAQAALYRSLVADKRILILLDNARDTAQVIPLLPGSPSCTVIVTSRCRLTGLTVAHGARLVDLGIMPEIDALELLTQQLGPARLTAEPDAVDELLTCCDGLPLALRIVASRAEHHPDFPLAVLADELREASTRLDGLAPDDFHANLRAVLSWSYQSLDTRLATVFGLLGLAPGPDASLPAAASLTALPTRQARAVLQKLENVYLVQQHVPGRYRMHDLVRLYALEQANIDLPDETQTGALLRLTDFYMQTAHIGDRLRYPQRSPIEIGPPTAGCLPFLLSDAEEALEWFDTEHPCLIAAQQLAIAQRWDTLTWQLAWTLNIFHWRRGHARDRVTCWLAGLDAAERLGDSSIRTIAHRLLGHSYTQVGKHAEGLNHLRQALILAKRVGDIRAQAHTHHALAWTWEKQGDDHRALTHATRALQLYRVLKEPLWEAVVLNVTGWLQARLGDYKQAREVCEHALTLSRQYHHREGEANTLDSLGYIAHHTGQHRKALGYYHQALIVYREVGDTYEESNTLDRLAEVYASLGEHAEAHDAWQKALNLYLAQHRTADAQQVQLQLDALGYQRDAT